MSNKPQPDSIQQPSVGQAYLIPRTQRTHREVITQAFLVCYALEPAMGGAALQSAAHISPVAIYSGGQAVELRNLMTTMSEKLVAFLNNFNIKLRLEYADINDFVGVYGLDEFLNKAYPGLASYATHTASSTKTAIDSLVVIRSFLNELTSGAANITQPR